MKTTVMSSWIPTNTWLGGVNKMTLENIVMVTEMLSLVPPQSNMMSGLESGLLQLMFVLFGSEDSMITILHTLMTVNGLTAPTPTSQTKSSQLISIALQTCLDHLVQTLFRPSRMENAQEIPHISAKKRLILLVNV